MTRRQPKGIRTGGQFAEESHNEAGITLQRPDTGSLTVQDGPEHGIAWDTPEDHQRFLEAASFIAECTDEGSVTPCFTRYRPEDHLDSLVLDVDARQLTIQGAGTESPTISHGEEPMSFRMEAGNTAGKTEYEILGDLIERARHDAACQSAWRGGLDAFEEGRTCQVEDFNVRFAGGQRISTLSVRSGGRYWDIVQRGDGEPEVACDSVNAIAEGPGSLDEVAANFDPAHREGTGAARFKALLTEAAERAAEEPGYNPRRL